MMVMMMLRVKLEKAGEKRNLKDEKEKETDGDTDE